MIKTIDS